MAGEATDKHLLLGNGFSIAYNAAIFDYSSLVANATFRGLSIAAADLTRATESENFEVIVERLNNAARVLGAYKANAAVVRTLRADAEVVRRSLGDVLAAQHPDNVLDMSDAQASSARSFVDSFKNVFTLSYDLLLYWLTSRVVDGRGPRPDGFERETYHPGPLVWKKAPTQGPQEIFFLHGALHLFEDGQALQKISYKEHGPLMKEVRGRLQKGIDPLIITEGTRTEKEDQIKRSRYLKSSHERFAQLAGALFIHGSALGGNDEHFLEAIESPLSRVRTVCVGVHDEQSPGGQRVTRRARLLQDRRRNAQGLGLRVILYDSSSARVWGI